MSEKSLEIRHWWIQKHRDSNMPLPPRQGIESVVFETFCPTTMAVGYEWVKVISQDDLQKVVGMGFKHWIECNHKLADLQQKLEVYIQLAHTKSAELEEAKKVIEFYADINQHAGIPSLIDLYDEKGKRAREFLKKLAAI